MTAPSAVSARQPVAAGRDAVTVCIVNYNTCADTLACLASLHEATYADLRIVLVDNASTDDSVARIRERFPEVTVVESATNLGFGGGCNRAASAARTRWLVFLNPDTVVAPGFIEPLIELARRKPSAGLYGGRTLRPDGVVDPRSCWGLPTLWSTFCFASGLSTAYARSDWFDPESLGPWERDTEREVDMVTGCLLMVGAELWAKLGGFDERYFMYGEDADLAFRARALGARPVIAPDAVVTHHVGTSSTTSGKLQLLYTGKATYIRSHFPAAQAPVAIALLKLGVGIRCAAYARRRPDSPLSAAYRDLWQRRRDWSQGWV